MTTQQVLANDPLTSRADYERALLALLKPVYAAMAEDHTLGRVHLGDSGSVYDQPRREIEGFMRTLWGIGPLCHTQALAVAHADYFEPACAGILAGVDPDSPWYWGQLADYDQLFVEMGSLATMLIMTKPFFYDRLAPKQQQHLFAWLDQINRHTIPKTNWLFFRVLVNTFFQHAQLPVPAGQLAADLAELDRYYLADGWYFDGYDTQIDYYIPFGMQYYGVLYSRLAYDQQEPHVALFRQRATAFAQTFTQWFADTGASIPFGRSLTYRFAQSAFWAVAAFADVPETRQTGAYLLQKNMHWWFNQPIFDRAGLLTIGYAYPNLVMAEGYNAPGSPYWALKNFIVLALEDGDPFFGAGKAPSWPAKSRNPYAHMLLVRGDDGNEVQAFTAGQHSHEHAHGESKYEKYVYSTTFGFSVKKGSPIPKQVAFDNTLAVSETELDFKTAFGYAAHAVHDDYVYALWRPYPDVAIQTFVVPLYPWHVRVHVIHNQRALHYLEGSFSAPAGGRVVAPGIYHSAVGTVGIRALQGNGAVSIAQVEPNTNLLYPRTLLPQLQGELPVGTSQLITACLGAAHRDAYPALSATLTGKLLTLTAAEATLTVELNELSN